MGNNYCDPSSRIRTLRPSTNSPLCNKLDGLGIGLEFGLKDPCGERLGRVVVQHRNGPLEDHGAVIVLVVGKVDRAAAELCPIVDDGLMYVMAVKAMSAKGRNQPRVDIRHAIGKVLGNGQPLEKSGHGDKVGLGGTAMIENRLAEFFLRRGAFRLTTAVGMPAS